MDSLKKGISQAPECSVNLKFDLNVQCASLSESKMRESESI